MGGIEDKGTGPLLRRVSDVQDGDEVLQSVLAEEGVAAEVELVAVNSDEDAQRLRFPGSPTVRVDGRDLFPAPEREDWRLGCRIYATPEGLRGSPTTEMLREALSKGAAHMHVRPITSDDVEDAYAAASATVAGDPGGLEWTRSRTPEEIARFKARYHHLLYTDPGGARVAVEGERVVGSALALRRERIWGFIDGARWQRGRP